MVMIYERRSLRANKVRNEQNDLDVSTKTGSVGTIQPTTELRWNEGEAIFERL